MELHELVERIQQWKQRQAVERGEAVDPVAAGETAAEAQHDEELGVAEAPMAEVASEYAEPAEGYGEAEELEPEAVEEVGMDAVEEIEEISDEAVEQAEAIDEAEVVEDATSEVDLDQIEELEEV